MLRLLSAGGRVDGSSRLSRTVLGGGWKRSATFYEGALADGIVRAVADHGGTFTANDLVTTPRPGGTD